MLGYRLISGDSLFKARSFCPNCKKNINWYDLIPLISWIALKGSCRFCAHSISPLYPFIEGCTALLFFTLFICIEPAYWLGYGLFFSALIITIRTDLHAMLISRFATLYLIPIAIGLSYFKLLPITIKQSALGSISALLFLGSIGIVFKAITKKDGIGQGDVELLACIGAFTGIVGWWMSLMLASVLGTIIGAGYLYIAKKKSSARIPFGPFLAAGAIGYVLFQKQIISLLLLKI